jgi:uncharacterized membrane protein
LQIARVALSRFRPTVNELRQLGFGGAATKVRPGVLASRSRIASTAAPKDAVMGLLLLVLGLLLFLGSHVFVAFRDQRAMLVARIGEGPYKGLFSLVSLAGLALIVVGFARYRASEWIDVWYPPVWTRHLTAGLMWPASVLVVAAYFPGRIKVALKHPMLAGIKLWAAAHLVANGDLGSIILFGTILGWAVFDRISLKHRTDPGGPSIPIGGLTNDVLAIAVGTIVYLALGYVFHPVVLGVPAFGG